MQFDKTKAQHERASRVIPGGVNSGVRSLAEPLPHHYTHAKGARLYDVDGHEFIDYSLGQGPMFLGHSPQVVIDAVKAQLDKGGIITAGQSEDEIIAAELLVKHIPCAEKVRFTTTGSEAVHAALRLARSTTGRDTVLRFEGHYHGWLDTIAWNHPARDIELGLPESPILRPSTQGQSSNDAANLIIRPWNNLEILEHTFTEHGNTLAAVICDPFASAAGLIPAHQSFLKKLRELCTTHGVVLIFDEVITGLRVSRGGAQEHYGITPDLATLAKALGAGMPVGALVGRADLMDCFTSGTVHSGTYNANPMVMAGTRAALEALLEDDGSEFQKAWDAGEELQIGLMRLAEKHGLPLHLRGVPTVFSASFVPHGSSEISDMRSAQQTDTTLGKRFLIEMLHRGIQLTSFGIWFISTAHTQHDIDETLTVADASMAVLVAEGI